MKAFLKGTVAALAALAPLFLLGSMLHAQEVTKITFMDWWGPPRSDGYLEIIEIFEAQNPHIEVEYIIGAGSRGTAEQAMVMAAGGTPVDLAAITRVVAAELIESGYPVDLTNLVARDFPDIDRILAPGATLIGSYRGRIYGLPKLFNISHMFVNLDLLDEAGLAVPTKAWSVDDLEVYARALARIDGEGNVTQYGVSLPRIPSNPKLLEIHGGTFLDEESGVATFNRPEFTRALQWIADLKNALQVMGGGTTQFVEGKTGILEDGYSSNIPTVLQSDVRWQTIWAPRGDAGQNPVGVVGHPIMIARASPHIDEAWEFLKFLVVSPEANRIKARLAMAPSAISGIQSMIDVADIPDTLSRDGIFAPFLNIAPHDRAVTPPEMTPGYVRADAELISPAIARVLNGEVGAQEAMDAIVGAVNAMLREYQTR